MLLLLFCNIFYIQQKHGLTQTGNNQALVKKCNNHNATAEKHGSYIKFFLTTGIFPDFPGQWKTRDSRLNTMMTMYLFIKRNLCAAIFW